MESAADTETVRAFLEASAKKRRLMGSARNDKAIVSPRKTAKPPPRSGFYGVRAQGKRAIATIWYGNKTHYIGSFDTKQEAALEYDRAARQCEGGRELNYDTIQTAEEAAAKAQSKHSEDLRFLNGNKMALDFLLNPTGSVNLRIKPNCQDCTGVPLCKPWCKQGLKRKSCTSPLVPITNLNTQHVSRKPLNCMSKTDKEISTQETGGWITNLHRKLPKSGYYGVSANRRKWVAQIYYGGKKHHLGSFDTKEAAALAYDQEALRYQQEKPIRATKASRVEAPGVGLQEA
jgi:hypothetical protein